MPTKSVYIATYWVANRFGSTVEKTRVFGGHLPEREVYTMMDRWITKARFNGQPIHHQFDLVREAA